MSHIDITKFSQIGRAVIEIELAAIAKMRDRINAHFTECCEMLLNTKGRIIVTGMGKSGIIGKKIASTLASTGSPAFFIHPGEASHGDLGMVTREDVILAISNSGTTQEILTILPVIKRLGIPLIVMTGQMHSILAKEADVCLDISVEKEACTLNLAPTASTTATLVMGDAIAITLLQARGFTEADFAFSHPSGRLGRRLLLRINDLMHTNEAVPKVQENALLSDALLEMTRKSLGMTAIVNPANQVLGIFTDGDLRRSLDKAYDVHSTKINEIMTKNCAKVKAGMLAAEALQLMENKKITALLVIDDQNKLIGVLHIHDLLHAGVV